jgi:prepilin-type N-terminal cleavage/methylation domain-containing protein
MEFSSFPQRPHAFTLIELLVVIAIIAVLMGLAFPVFQSVQNSAKRTQAKNDLVQIVTATTAYYTEYGTYPNPATSTSDVTFGTSGTPNNQLFNELRGTEDAQSNLRRIAFISPPIAKDANNPKGGIGPNDGRWYDPWGTQYQIRLDTDYDGKVASPYSGDVDQGVIAWSLGKDRDGGSGDKNVPPAKDDVISWQ